MRTRKAVLTAVVGAFFLALCLQGQAHLVHIGSYTDNVGNDPATQAAWIEGTLGLDGDSLIFLAKFERDEGWAEGGLTDPGGNIDLDFFQTDGDYLTGEVYWNLTGTGFELSYMLVKSGRDQYNLYGVTADQVLTSNGWEGFDNGTNPLAPPEISHVTFFGQRTSDIPGVPDSGLTLAMLGAGIAALGIFKRRRKA